MSPAGRLRWAVASGASALALGLAACGGSVSEDVPVGPAGEPPAAATTTPQGVPLEPGGDNSIATFGSEASGDEQRSVGRVAAAHTAARAAGRWREVCRHLSRKLTRELRALASSSPRLRDAGCAGLLAAVHPARAPASIRAQRGPIDLLSVRVGEGRAFAIYRIRNGDVYYLPLRRQGNGWKVGSVNAAPLPG